MNKPPAPIALLTDFGERDCFVGRDIFAPVAAKEFGLRPGDRAKLRLSGPKGKRGL